MVLRLPFRCHFSAQFAKQGAPLAFSLLALHFGVFLLLVAAGNACHDVGQRLIVLSWAARASRRSCSLSVMDFGKAVVLMVMSPVSVNVKLFC